MYCLTRLIQYYPFLFYNVTYDVFIVRVLGCKCHMLALVELTWKPVSFYGPVAQINQGHCENTVVCMDNQECRIQDEREDIKSAGESVNRILIKT